jgi:hypothetical protein
MLVIARNRILRPIAGSLFHGPPKSTLQPNSALQIQYRRTAKSSNDLDRIAPSRLTTSPTARIRLRWLGSASVIKHAPESTLGMASNHLLS